MAGALTRVELNHRGIAKLLKSPQVRRDLERRAQAIAQAAGPGHKIEVEDTPTRVHAMVWTDTFEARHREATTRSLTRAIDAGRQ